MRRAFSVIFHVIAGFFFYGVTVMGFINTPQAPEAKWFIVPVFLVLAALFLLGGLAVMRFRNWKRESGVVLLSSMGFSAFAVFSIACMFMSEEFRAMMPPESMDAFSDYITGSVFIAALAALGFMLVRAEKTTTTEAPRPDGEDTAIQL